MIDGSGVISYACYFKLESLENDSISISSLTSSLCVGRSTTNSKLILCDSPVPSHFVPEILILHWTASLFVVQCYCKGCVAFQLGKKSRSWNPWYQSTSVLSSCHIACMHAQLPGLYRWHAGHVREGGRGGGQGEAPGSLSLSLGATVQKR